MLGLQVSTEGIPTQGMLDGDILATMRTGAGVSARFVRREMPRLMLEAQRVYEHHAPMDLRSKVCPGARAVLRKLNRRGVPAGLVTGNLSRIAWRKMRSAGLGRFLRFGAFAESADTRAELVRLALAEARRKNMLSAQTKVWLVGDHPNDVNAARANSIGAIAVKTGMSSHDELAGHGPDLLIDDLRGLEVDKLW